MESIAHPNVYCSLPAGGPNNADGQDREPAPIPSTQEQLSTVSCSSSRSAYAIYKPFAKFQGSYPNPLKMDLPRMGSINGENCHEAPRFFYGFPKKIDSPNWLEIGCRIMPKTEENIIQILTILLIRQSLTRCRNPTKR